MKKKLAIVGVVAALLITGGVEFGIYRSAQMDKGKEAQKEVVQKESVQEEPIEEPESTVEVPIDFAALQAQNPETYAWIRIPGTTVDYPILQSESDDLYYLSHSVEKAADPAGAIFTQKGYNSKDMNDPNTLIYGHNMRSQTMFHDLHAYEDRAFFDNNREVIIYLPGEIRTYRIFAAYLYDDRHILHSFDFQNKEVYQEYLNSIYAMRDMKTFVDTEMEVTAEDKIITLSTCDTVDQNSRYLVQAVLVSIEN